MVFEINNLEKQDLKDTRLGNPKVLAKNQTCGKIPQNRDQELRFHGREASIFLRASARLTNQSAFRHSSRKCPESRAGSFDNPFDLNSENGTKVPKV